MVLVVWFTVTLVSPLKFTWSPGPTLLGVVLPLVATFQPLLAVVFTSFNWLTFTASVKAKPLATPAMTLPPLFRPVLVRETVLPVAGVIVTPLEFVTVLPVVTLPLGPKLTFSANLMFKVLVKGSATTPILPVVRAAPDVAPPVTFKVSPSLRLTSPESPANPIGVLAMPVNASPTLL